MFERFTEAARQVVVTGQEEARGLKHNYIGTEHLLLGLVSVDSVARDVLAGRGLELSTVRAEVARVVGAGDEVTTGQIPFSPRAKETLEGALREALSLGHGYIGPEHVLLGLCRQVEGVGAKMLEDRYAVRDAVVEALHAQAGTRPRCEQAFSLYGATFVCQRARGHVLDYHVEHGDGWVVRWDPV